jgi:thiamine kinase
MFMPEILFIRQQGIRLIDWEYAGDGDVALELAAVWTESDDARQTLIRNYARVAHIDADALRRQVNAGVRGSSC